MDSPILDPNPQDHPLFHQYPLAGQRELSAGTVPVPYHIYAGHASLLGGTVDVEPAKDLMKGQKVQPIETADGQALMAIWIIYARDASLGPHLELQFSLLAAHRPLEGIQSYPFTILELITSHPDARLYPVGLWNDTPLVVAYNREILGLDAHLAHGTIQRNAISKTKYFQFSKLKNEKLIFEGSVHEEEDNSLGNTLTLLRQPGYRRIHPAVAHPKISVQVVNPMNATIHNNADAQTYTVSSRPVLQLFNPRTDQITFGDKSYAGLNFTPQFIEHLDQLKFVYLNPHNTGEING